MNGKCPRCGKEITVSVKFGNESDDSYTPVCLPCLTKVMKAKKAVAK